MIPTWTKIYLTIVSIMALAFSLLAYFNPSIQFGTWETLSAAGATSLAGPIGLYIARNLATVAVGAFALKTGALGAITAAFVLRAVTDGLDGVHNLIGGNVPGAGFALVMFAIEAFALTKLFGARPQG
jgi:hypothetical protein